MCAAKVSTDLENPAEHRTSASDDLVSCSETREHNKASEDAKTWRFKLRQDVNYHKGREFTAKDVARNLMSTTVGQGSPSGVTELPQRWNVRLAVSREAREWFRLLRWPLLALALTLFVSEPQPAASPGTAFQTEDRVSPEGRRLLQEGALRSLGPTPSDRANPLQSQGPSKRPPSGAEHGR